LKHLLFADVVKHFKTTVHNVLQPSVTRSLADADKLMRRV